ncbi:hypothetical protein [Streptomyces sp. P17]|uniref:hypothetical protein n=1 Tax=Streptomyces sp. P17 TaxID=3074716 RepID=UPI0028F45177|nr:hypothetical protein [Streptomyces sp. P17]MDT9694715.1 hypothetical protein [Streptomyces sp. P17]
MLTRELDLTRTIVDRGTDNPDQDPASAVRPGAAADLRSRLPAGYAIRCRRMSTGNFAEAAHACIQWQDR